ncbi:MAG: PEP-CTERM sorting domain-containing protein [Verrucomicrobia bacterium]|nr:PEP-CTERM sorting domain-containing protein [Verrucomicrobiota bacterium]
MTLKVSVSAGCIGLLLYALSAHVHAAVVTLTYDFENTLTDSTGGLDLSASAGTPGPTYDSGYDGQALFGDDGRDEDGDGFFSASSILPDYSKSITASVRVLLPAYIAGANNDPLFGWGDDVDFNNNLTIGNNFGYITVRFLNQTFGFGNVGRNSTWHLVEFVYTPDGGATPTLASGEAVLSINGSVADTLTYSGAGIGVARTVRAGTGSSFQSAYGVDSGFISYETYEGGGEGSTVPEPGTLSLLGSALVFTSLLKKKHLFHSA